MGAQRIFGEWWVAGRRDTSARGTLEIAENGSASLELHGVLGISGESAALFSGEPQGEYRIIGQLENTSFATLEGCLLAHTRGVFSVPHQEWHVGQALLGVEFDETEQWEFHAACTEIAGLTRWTSHTHAQSGFSFDAQGRPKGLSVSFGPFRKSLWVLDGIEVALCRQGGTRQTAETVTELRSSVALTAKADDRASVDRIDRAAIRPVQLLLALATGMYCGISEMSLGLEIAESEPRLRYFPCHREHAPSTIEATKAHYAFLYGDIEALGPELLQAWVERASHLAPAVDLYLASLRGVNFVELSFLILAQALEAYHRRTSDEKAFECLNWSEGRTELAEVFAKYVGDDDARVAFARRIEHADELSLKRRLVALLAQIDAEAERIAGSKPNRFARQVVETRNYFTHWDSAGETPAARDEALYFLKERMTALLELLLLRDLGFPPDSKPAQEVLRRRVDWLPKI